MTRLLSLTAALLLAAAFTTSPAAQEQAPASAQVPAAPAAAQAPRAGAPPAPAQQPAVPASPSASPAADQPPPVPSAPAPPPVPDDIDDRPDNTAFRLGQDFTLAAGDRATDAVVIFGNATIAGEIEEDVVVILGTARIARTAAIGNDFVVIGGTATVEEGASVGNDLVVVGGALDAPAAFTPGGEQVIIGPTILGGSLSGIVPWLTRGLMWGRPIVPDLPWVWWIVAFFFVIYLAVNALFDRTAYATAEVVRDKPLTAFGAGLLVLLGTGPAFLVLALSIIGIAVMPFLLCALIGAWVLGKVSVARGLGAIIASDEAGNRPLGARAFTIGFALLCLAYMIPVLGVVAWAISGVIGLGAAAMTFIAAYRREAPPAPVSAAPPPIPAHSDAAPVPPPGSVAGAATYATAAAAPAAGMVPPAAPAAVAAISFPYARFRDRLAAFVLDVILVMLAVQLIDPRQEGRAFFLGLLVYHVGLWTWKQTTVGGIICQLRVVRTNGNRLSFADALVRGLSSIFSLAVAGLGVLWILRDPERQAWHDKIAGTYVVKVPRNYPV